jgi:hypothetical protein
VPRAKKTVKEVQVVGPVLIVDGVEVVSFKTDFKASNNAVFDQGAISSVAFQHHSQFIESITATAGKEEAKPAQKPTQAIKQ